MVARDGCQRFLPEMAARDDVPEKHARDGCPRWLSEMLARDTCPRWLSEKHAREACPRRLPEMAARDGCPRCLGHIFEQVRAQRTLMNTDPKTEAKSGHKTAHKRWAPTVGAHTLVYNLGPFSGLIIRAQQRDPVGTWFDADFSSTQQSRLCFCLEVKTCWSVTCWLSQAVTNFCPCNET